MPHDPLWLCCMLTVIELAIGSAKLYTTYNFGLKAVATIHLVVMRDPIHRRSVSLQFQPLRRRTQQSKLASEYRDGYWRTTQRKHIHLSSVYVSCAWSGYSMNPPESSAPPIPPSQYPMSLAPCSNAGEKYLSTVSQYRVDKAIAETG